MAKMLRLIQNEFIKSFKKISTIILFVIVVVVGIGFTALMYFAIEEEKSWNQEMYGYEKLDYDTLISDCEIEGFTGYELQIEMWEYLRDNEIPSPESWKYFAVEEAFAYEVEETFDDEGNVKGTAYYTYDDATRKQMLNVVETNDWKTYCEYMIKRNNAMGMPEELNWQYQYRLDNNIAPPEKIEDFDDYKNRLISQVAMAKDAIANGATKEEQEALENDIKLALYRLDNDIRVNVADYSMNGDWPDYTIWICLVNSSMIVSFIGLLVVVLAGSSVANEFSQGTIKFLLINPVKRWKILVSKYITCLLTGYALIMVFYVATLLISMVLFGTADIGADYIKIANGEIVTTSGIVYIFKTYMIKSINVVVMATLAFAISSLVRSSGLAIGVSVFSLLGGNTVVQLLAQFKQDWARYLIWANTDLTVIASDGSMFPNHSLGFAIAVIIAHMVVFGLIAWDGFTKREV